MRFGANYVPRVGWWHAWMDWRPEEIRRDLEALAGLGMDHVRIHLLWPVFQPNENRVSARALDHLAELMDLAYQAGLDVWITVLDGWLSGFAFVPAWMEKTATREKLNMFTSPEAIAAEERLFRALADRIHDHPRFKGFDLGNELGVMAHFGHPHSSAEADSWSGRMFELLAEISPDRDHVNGVDHSHWFGDFSFSRSALAHQGAMTVLHCWSLFTGALERGRRETEDLIPFMSAWARAHNPDPSRRIWVQEFGFSQQWMETPWIVEAGLSQEEIMAVQVRAAHGSGAWGITVWCSHDLEPDLLGFHPLEYDLGLIDTHGRVKPVGRRVAEEVARLRDVPAPAPGASVEAIAGEDTWTIAERWMATPQGPAIRLREPKSNS